MTEYTEVARATSARGEVVLRRRDGDVLELRVNGVFVMDTAETSSEEALATHALGLAAHPARVLVGGLGLGVTTRTLLADPRVDQVDVAEIEDALVGWMRDGTVPGGPQLLAEPRVHVVIGDVAAVVAAADPAAYDVVLLDVDNGPRHLVHAENARVYETGFLQSCKGILASGGVLVVWAANDAPELATALAHVFGDVTRVAYPVRLQRREEEYLLYVAHA